MKEPIILRKYFIFYSSADNDSGDSFHVWAEEDTFSTDALMYHMNLRDTQNTGLTNQESAGFDLVLTRPEERSAVVRTRGLGPKTTDNIMLIVGWRASEETIIATR